MNSTTLRERLRQRRALSPGLAPRGSRVRDDDIGHPTNAALVVLAVAALIALIVFLAWWEWSGESNPCRSEQRYGAPAYACDGDPFS